MKKVPLISPIIAILWNNIICCDGASYLHLIAETTVYEPDDLNDVYEVPEADTLCTINYHTQYYNNLGDVKNIGVRCCPSTSWSKHYGPRTGSDACIKGSTYYEAKAYCKYIGKQLCSAHDVTWKSADFVQSGCWKDHQMVWVKDECQRVPPEDVGKDGHIVINGNDESVKCVGNGDASVEVCCCDGKEYTDSSMKSNQNYGNAKKHCESKGKALCSLQQLKHKSSSCGTEAKTWTNIACRTTPNLDNRIKTTNTACSRTMPPQFELYSAPPSIDLNGEAPEFSFPPETAAEKAWSFAKPFIGLGSGMLGNAGPKGAAASAMIGFATDVVDLYFEETDETEDTIEQGFEELGNWAGENFEEIEDKYNEMGEWMGENIRKTEKAFAQMGDWVEEELDEVYECLQNKIDTLEDELKHRINSGIIQDEAEECAKVVRAAMEATKNKWTTMATHKQALLVDLNNAWSYLINYPAETTDAQTLALMMPSYGELATMYSKELPIYLGMAQGYCENGGSNDLYGCAYTDDNVGCCIDYTNIISFEQQRIPDILDWIYDVKDKLKVVYFGVPSLNNVSPELKRWDRNFYEAYIQNLEELYASIRDNNKFPQQITFQSEPTPIMKWQPDWYLSEAGKTCDDTCNAKDLMCDAEMQSKITSVGAIQSIAKHIGIEITSHTTWSKDPATYAGAPFVNALGRGIFVKPGTQSVCDKNHKPNKPDISPLCYCKTRHWYLGVHGASCDDTCLAEGLQCDADKQSEITSRQAMESVMKQVGLEPNSRDSWKKDPTEHTPYVENGGNKRGYFVKPGKQSVCNGSKRGRKRLCYCVPSDSSEFVLGNGFDDGNDDIVLDEPAFDDNVNVDNEPKLILIPRKYLIYVGAALMASFLCFSLFCLYKASACKAKAKYNEVCAMSDTELENL